ncbi:MAG TPA: glycosyl hydrolase, partial [Gemmatimonadaceae bacterium]
PITKDQTSVEYYATIFTVAESPIARGTIWTGSDDGLVYVTRDDGKTWTNVTPKGLPEWARISIIEASHFAPGTAYLAANRYQLDDQQPYLYRTTDYGATWTRIDAALPREEFTRVIREDPARRGLLFAGTERGVWVSFDDGAPWQSLRRNLPQVPVHDLAVKDGDLVAATHGRSFWILDDISPLEQLGAADAKASVHLFKPRDAYRVSWGGGFGGDRGAHPEGKNPPSGAVIYYTLAKPHQEVTLEFLDAKGSSIRKFSSLLDSAGRADSVRADSVKRARTDSLTKAGIAADSIKKLEKSGEETEPEGRRPPPRPPRVPDKAGLNAFVWDLRYPDASTFEDMILWAGMTRGPVAVPGTYTVRLTTNGETQTRTFVVRKDPRVQATQRDLQEQFALLIKLRDAVSRANDAVTNIRHVKRELVERKAKAPASYGDEAQRLADRLSAIEAEIYQVKNRSSPDPLNYPIRLNNKIAALAGAVASADARPTAQDYAVYLDLTKQLDTQLAALKSVLGSELPKVNAALKSAGLREVR